MLHGATIGRSSVGRPRRRRYDARVKVGYLGPRGTFAEEALGTQADLAAGEAVPMRSVPHVISAVEAGEVDLGFVPLENSIEGSVSATLDTLAFDTDLLIQREVDLPVSLSLGAKPGTRLDDVTVVLSHPNPLGQSRMWLGRKLPQAITRVANSTAEAAQEVAKSKKPGLAAIANPSALERYGLELLATEIEDHPSETRFVVVGHGIPARTGHDKTSVVCFQRVDRPGSLLALLQEFAARAINLTKLESRPTKRGLGEYCFFIDFEGHVVRRAGGRLPPQRRREAGRGEVPRVVPRLGARGGARQAEGGHQGLALRDRVGRRAAGPGPGLGRPSVIDLRRLREEPDYRLGIERKRVAPGLLDDLVAADDARRALLTEVEELRRRQNVGVEGDRQGRARRASGQDRRGRGAQGGAPGPGAGAGRRGGRRCATSPCASRTRPTRRCPTAARTTAWWCARSAPGPTAHRRATTPSSPTSWASWRPSTRSR